MEILDEQKSYLVAMLVVFIVRLMFSFISSPMNADKKILSTGVSSKTKRYLLENAFWRGVTHDRFTLMLRFNTLHCFYDFLLLLVKGMKNYCSLKIPGVLSLNLQLLQIKLLTNKRKLYSVIFY